MKYSKTEKLHEKYHFFKANRIVWRFLSEIEVCIFYMVLIIFLSMSNLMYFNEKFGLIKLILSEGKITWKRKIY